MTEPEFYGKILFGQNDPKIGFRDFFVGLSH